LLAAAKPVLRQRYGVIRLTLFGSPARAEVCPDSDVDVLVAFDGAASAERWVGVPFYLDDLLGRPGMRVSACPSNAPRL